MMSEKEARHDNIDTMNARHETSDKPGGKMSEKCPLCGDEMVDGYSKCQPDDCANAHEIAVRLIDAILGEHVLWKQDIDRIRREVLEKGEK